MPDSFYKITKTTQTEGGQDVELILNSLHPLFKGHFPELPILPGACMVQLTHHLVNKYLGGKSKFVKAANIKFLSPINPLVQPHLTSTLKVKNVSEGMYKIENQLSDKSTVFFKYSATFSFHA